MFLTGKKSPWREQSSHRSTERQKFTFQINSCGLKAAFHTGLSEIFTVIIKINEASDYQLYYVTVKGLVP